MPEGKPPPAEDAVWDALRTVDDPEVGMNIVDLGLVYGVEVRGDDVSVRLTMTSPACPLGESIVRDASAAIRAAAPGAGEIEIALVWEPPWTPERMSDAARKRFGW
jgi:metal-sulfur cluster biosynthetic enzyme